jgi:hypothetical protein
LVHYSGYNEFELEESTSLTLEFISGNLIEKYDSIFKKYSQRKFMKASIFAQDWVKKAQDENRVIMDGAVRVGFQYEGKVREEVEEVGDDE